jgi:hypothetical protein
MNSMDAGGENGFWLWVMALLPRELDNDKGRLTHGFMDEDKAMDEPLRLVCWCDYIEVLLPRSTQVENLVVPTQTSSHDLVW